MSTTSTTPTAKKDSTKATATTKAPAKTTTEKASTSKAAPAKTATKASTKAPAKTATEKAPKAEKVKVEKVKTERKSRKGITRTFAEDVTAVVSPIMSVVTNFINDPATSEDALKMIRLELRKAVKGTRGTLKTRKTVKA